MGENCVQNVAKIKKFKKIVTCRLRTLDEMFNAYNSFFSDEYEEKLVMYQAKWQKCFEFIVLSFMRQGNAMKLPLTNIYGYDLSGSLLFSPEYSE